MKKFCYQTTKSKQKKTTTTTLLNFENVYRKSALKHINNVQKQPRCICFGFVVILLWFFLQYISFSCRSPVQESGAVCLTRQHEDDETIELVLFVKSERVTHKRRKQTIKWMIKPVSKENFRKNISTSYLWIVKNELKGR